MGLGRSDAGMAYSPVASRVTISGRTPPRRGYLCQQPLKSFLVVLFVTIYLSCVVSCPHVFLSLSAVLVSMDTDKLRGISFYLGSGSRLLVGSDLSQGCYFNTFCSIFFIIISSDSFCYKLAMVALTEHLLWAKCSEPCFQNNS